jgi:hypothetical protein
MGECFLPAAVLALTVPGLIFGAFCARRTLAGRDALNRSIGYFGAVSVTATVLAISLALVLVVGLWSGLGSALDDPGVVVLCLVGAAFLLKLLSWHADGARRLLEAHCDLKGATSLPQDTVERLAAVQDKGSAHSG